MEYCTLKCAASWLSICRAISSYEENNNEGKEFEVTAAFKAFGNFVYIFLCSFIIGSLTGCVTALISFAFCW